MAPRDSGLTTTRPRVPGCGGRRGPAGTPGTPGTRRSSALERGHPTEARVYLWVRQSAYERGLDPLLFAAVRDWLAAEWPFGQVLFPGRDADGGWRPLEGKAV